MGNNGTACPTDTDITILICTRNHSRMMINACHLISWKICYIRIIFLSIYRYNVIFFCHMGNVINMDCMNPKFLYHMLCTVLFYLPCITNGGFHTICFQKHLHAKCCCQCVRIREIVCLQIHLMILKQFYKSFPIHSVSF